MKKTLLLIITSAATISVSKSALINVNFYERTDGWIYHERIDRGNDGTTAGVSPASGWNELLVPDGNESFSNLLDTTGASTSVGLNLSGNFGYFNFNNVDSPGPGAGNKDDVRLMSTHVGRSGSSAPLMTLSGIDYASYDLIVYLGLDVNDRQAQISVGGETFHYTTQSNTTFEASGATFVEATSTNIGSPTSRANYVRFTGLTGDSQVINFGTSGSNAGISGFQIVSIPEPSTAAFGLVALLGLLRRKR